MIGILLAAIIELTPGAAFVAPGGKLAHVEAVSTVAAGTVSVMSEVRIETNAVTNGWIFPGDVLFFEGTAKGRVMLIIEK